MLLLLTILCVGMMFVTFVTNVNLEPVQTVSGYVIVPIQKGINNIGLWLSDKVDYRQTLQELQAENQQLKEKVNELTIENSELVQDTYELGRLRDMYQLATGETDVERDEVIVNVQGINHFTWFDRASCRGVDLFPIYRKFIDEHFEDGYHDPDRNWMNGTFNCAHRVKMDLFNKYGNIAAAGDRHLAEFLPGDVYLRDPEQVHQWKFALTPVSWRKERQAEKIEEAKRLASGEEELKLEATGEEGILLMKALCGLNRMVSNVNIPNTAGQIPNLPRTAVVETNAVFYKGTIQPIFAGEMKPVIRDLVMPHVENHERILEAAMKPNFGLAYEAFMNDPLVHGRISREDGEKLLKEMIQNTLDVLPEGWKKEIQ